MFSIQPISLGGKKKKEKITLGQLRKLKKTRNRFEKTYIPLDLRRAKNTSRNFFSGVCVHFLQDGASTYGLRVAVFDILLLSRLRFQISSRGKMKDSISIRMHDDELRRDKKKTNIFPSFHDALNLIFVFPPNFLLRFLLAISYQAHSFTNDCAAKRAIKLKYLHNFPRTVLLHFCVFASRSTRVSRRSLLSASLHRPLPDVLAFY